MLDYLLVIASGGAHTILEVHALKEAFYRQSAPNLTNLIATVLRSKPRSSFQPKRRRLPFLHDLIDVVIRDQREGVAVMVAGKQA